MRSTMESRHASCRLRSQTIEGEVATERVCTAKKIGKGWVGPSLLYLVIGVGAERLQGNGKRKRNAILAEFFEGDFGDLSKTVTIENVGDGVAHIEHEKTEAAVLLVGAGAFGVGRVAHASDWCERSVNETHDLAHRDVFRGLREEEAAMLAALAIDDAGLA